MKKIKVWPLLLAASMLLTLTACGQGAEPREAEPSGFDPAAVKTMGDVFAFVEEGEYQEAWSETDYVFVFNLDDTYFRAHVQLPEDISEELWEIEFDEQRDQKVRELLAPVTVDRIEDLSGQILSREELDKLIGKRGQELFDAGWTYWCYDLEDMTAGMNYGPFTYDFSFDYEGEQMENSDDFDFYRAFADLTISAADFGGLGDASVLD